ncbi:MAG: LPS-assembly protein LptD, partial [Bacteroidetes bacterium]
MLIKCSLYSAFAQENFKDTLRLDDDSFSEIIKYSARDSLFTDLKNEQIHLYGAAKVDDGQIQMTAGYILIDLKKNEVLASYRLDEDSNKVELPSFSDGSEPITASTIRYNFDTEKGYIEELTIKQDESFIYMGIAKRHPNEEIHFKNGRFTTCDLEEPHYHFQLSKAILIPEERIVTGPMNLYVAGIPTPLGLPFSVIPQQKERTHGLLFPELVPLSSYGFGFQNLGYYIPINDHLQTSAYINLYSRGSWGIRNDLDYAKRYGYRGNLDIGFQQFRLGFPSDARNNKVSVFWKHTKEPKSNPYWNFGANVNFISDNQSKNNLDPLNPD